LVELVPNWRVFIRLKIAIPTPLGTLSLHYNQGTSEVLEIPAGMRLILRDDQNPREFVGPGSFSLDQNQ